MSIKMRKGIIDFIKNLFLRKALAGKKRLKLLIALRRFQRVLDPLKISNEACRLLYAVVLPERHEIIVLAVEEHTNVCRISF